jgi:hypothetical protein
MLKKDKRAKRAKPGYFFIKFKWFLKTKYRKEVNRINKMWEYLTLHCNYVQRARVGYVQTGFTRLQSRDIPIKKKYIKKRKRPKSDR